MKSRRGFTLIELLMSLTLTAIAGTFMLSTLVRQQRFYSSASEILDTRSQLRDAAGILTTDIRAAAVALGVPVMRDSAIEMFTVVASSIVCTGDSRQSFGLPPRKLVSGASLTSVLAQPDTGDVALVYTTAWEVRKVSAFASRSGSTSCAASTPFTDAADIVSGNPAFAVTIDVPTSDSVFPGAPILFARRARYSLYRSSDNKWYLGYRRCAAFGASSCGAVQPVAGPYDPYPGGAPGIAFRYFDRSGSELDQSSDGGSLARVDIVIRGRSAKKSGLSGNVGPAWRDSIAVSVATRNRMR
jgi:prepilin-type N-terminal cleavage/methylation domain-containing protein